MLIVALVLAVIGLAALVTAVVTSNELVAWVCIGASGLGVLLSSSTRSGSAPSAGFRAYSHRRQPARWALRLR